MERNGSRADLEDELVAVAFATSAAMPLDGRVRASQLDSLSRMGCTLREARVTADLFDVLRRTVIRRLPLTLELDELAIVLRRRERTS